MLMSFDLELEADVSLWHHVRTHTHLLATGLAHGSEYFWGF